ncbi:MAG TPA: sensor histidine kinase [Lacunisphaera sp.]|nr:sensor histidine kinase [Lacunisphaera sp.]
MDFDARDDTHRTGSLYGAMAFASIVMTCFTGFFVDRHFFGPAERVPVTFALGALYVTLGVLSAYGLKGGPVSRLVLYYLVQCGLLTVMIFISPSRGFFGLIVLPLASQCLFDLRPRNAALVVAYLFLVNIGLWSVDYGWGGAFEAVYSYAAGFAFTIIFTLVTRRAVAAREREEKLRREMEVAHAQLKDYAAQAEDLATTRERNRLAREIHDGIGHYLTVVKTQLDAASALLPAQPEKARESVGKAARLTAEALDDVRRSVGALRTDSTRPPLPEAIRELASHTEPIPALAIEGEPRPMAPGIEHALYRAAQEGLTNIRKHARATRALVRLDYRGPERVVLELADNGIGADSAAKNDGFGLRGLRERIELLGGKVDSGNRLEGGFALRVELPA